MATTAPQLETSAPLGSAPLSPAWISPLADDKAGGGHVAAEISTRMVGLLRRDSGRGPTKAKTTVFADLVVVCLEDCLTTLERRLVALGHPELVDSGRAEILEAIRVEATEVVESLTRRQVDAYLTDQRHDPDISVLIFFVPRPLESIAHPGPGLATSDSRGR